MTRRTELIAQAAMFLDRATEDSVRNEYWIGEAIRCLQQAARAEDDGVEENDSSRRRLI
jgi:hypothetical protein